MDKLIFSYNWNNKLVGKYFTTLRLRNDQRFRIGEVFEIDLQKKNIPSFFCYATLIDLRNMKLKDINSFVAAIDTGYSVTQCQALIKTMYKKKDIDWDTQYLTFLLFQKNEKYTPILDLDEIAKITEIE